MMRLGNITRTAWQRSVRRQLHTEDRQMLFEMSPAENCSGFESEDGACFVWADAHAAGDSGRIGYYAVLQAAGELAAKGVRPREVSVRILFPQETEEEKLKELTAGIAEACERIEMQVSALHGEVTPAVIHTVVCAHAVGTAERDHLIGKLSAGKSADMDAAGGRKAAENGTARGKEAEILLCGYAGLEGTLRILDEAEEELSSRFVSAFLDQTKELKNELVTPEQLLSCETERILAARQIGSGGILAALWELAEDVDAGFEIDMANIALKQETVEICEFYRLNPYQMTSAGSFLIVTTEAEQVIELLKGAGARAGRLGVTKAQNARVITSGTEMRYLDRPAPDELVNWMAKREPVCG